jgi:hypothetical protein
LRDHNISNKCCHLALRSITYNKELTFGFRLDGRGGREEGGEEEQVAKRGAKLKKLCLHLEVVPAAPLMQN